MSAYTHLTTDQKFDLLMEGQSRLEKDMSGLKTDVSSLKTDVTGLKKDMKSVKRTLRTIHIDQNMIIDHFDRADIRTEQRLDRIENHLDLPPIC